MLRIVIAAAAIAVAAASVPVLIENNPRLLDGLRGDGSAVPEDNAEAVAKARQGEAGAGIESLPGRKVRLAADARGHFSADFRLNGRSVPAMVDTGASVVAINETTARRIGIRLSPSDFTGSARTANGTTKAAGVTIERIEIGRVEFRDVQAVVLEDEALSHTLIGMSFLSRLTRYGVEGGAMVLEE